MNRFIRTFTPGFCWLVPALAFVAVAALRAAPPPVDQPAADPKATVVVGHARFSVLTSRLLRLEWSADGRFEDRASLVFINRALPVPAYTVTREGGATIIRTDALTLRYAPGTGDGRFAAENLTIRFSLNGAGQEWRPGMPDTGNLMGTTRTLDRAKGAKTIEPIEPGLVSRAGWTVVDDSARPLFDRADFSFSRGAQSPRPWVLPRASGERQDWYFFGYGHDYKAALGDYVRVAGPIPLPPRFAFGTWWSRYWAYSDQEIESLVEGFRAHSIPLDVFVIDMDWHLTFGDDRNVKDASGNRKGWSGYTWNRLLFPEPQPFLQRLHRAGLKVSLNLHPASGVQPWEDCYPEMARAMGIDPATKQYVPFEITDQKFARNYMDIIHRPLERQGVDFWWLDWQQKHTTAIAGLNPTWWLNYVHFTDQQREGKRPLLFHRWGGLGNHRYQIGFSGDTISVWESLAFQPWFTAAAANVGYAYWSHDIGGHMPGAVDPELYLRWIQFGVFSPILRTHTTKNPDAERRIWAYPEPYSDLMRDAFRLRHALVPYLYSEARRTYDTGVAFLRPLYYDWPEADAAYEAKGQYSFGDQMVVAPVTAPVAEDGLARTSVWVPPGEWIEWSTGRHLRGPATVTRTASIEEVPVYVRPGTIIPMQASAAFAGAPAAQTVLTIFPLNEGQTSTYRWYEDDGVGVRYQSGACRWTTLETRQRGDELTLRIAAAEGDSTGLPAGRAYDVRLPADWPPESVVIDGTAAARSEPGEPGWRFEGDTLTTVITTRELPTNRDVTITVRRAAGRTARRPELDGFAGGMTRLRGAYTALIYDHPYTVPPDALVRAYQTGRRLGFQPDAADAEIGSMPAQLTAARQSIAEWVTIAQGSDDEIARALKLKASADSDTRGRDVLRFRRAVKVAAAALDDAAAR